MPGPLSSQYPNALDSPLSLSTGTAELITSLAVAFEAGETDTVEVVDGVGAEVSGTLVINDSEIVYYHKHYKDEPHTFVDLLRGREGTEDVSHPVGAPVRVYGRPRYVNPGLAAAIIALQTKVNEYEARIATLEKSR
jgi:hypothetical protein